MKPISLTIKGLHSFREKQEIDFGSLCEGGIFGIFGPTGSGKSSILDAMTLALYGKVERAANNTQGIMNHAEDTLSVSFTFELQNQTEMKRYTIERGFKRTDDIRIKTASSRLIEVSEESIVLADKTGEVNQSIESLLGLTIDDFTRAVVLPQGKFAEFLSLKGVDRRQMLQRLFNLEQYGDKLNKKLKIKVSKTKSELNEIVAEQNGLGNASKEAMIEAEKTVKEAEILLGKRQTELKDIEAKWDQAQKIWNWQLELKDLKNKKAELEKEEDVIKELAGKVAKAQAADKLLPYLEEYESASIAVEEWKRKHQEFSVQLERLKEELQISVKKYQEARSIKSEFLPSLITKKQQLTDAKVLVAKVKKGKVELKGLKGQLSEFIRKKDELKNDLDNSRRLLNKAFERQKQLKEELGQKTVAPSFRETIRKAYEQKLQIGRLLESVNELHAGLKEKEGKEYTLKQELEKLENELSHKKDRLKAIFTKVESIYLHVCEREKDLEYLSLHTEKELSATRQKLEELKLENLAVHLAHQLKPGHACPVCGSVEHPSPVTIENVEISQIETSVSSLDKELALGREVSQTLSALKLQLEQISERLVLEYPGELNTKLNSSLNDEEDKHHTVKSIVIEGKALKQDMIEIQSQVQIVIHDLREVVQKKQQVEHSVKMTATDIEEHHQKLAVVNDKLNEQKQRWLDAFTELDYDFIEEKQTEIAKLDEEYQDISSRIEKSVPFIDEKEKEIEGKQEIYFETDRALTELSSTIGSKEERIAEDLGNLEAQLGNHDVDDLLDEMNQRIQTIEEDESAAYDKWQTTQATHQKVEIDTSSALKALEEATKRLGIATGKWLEMKEKSSFVSNEDVRLSIISAVEQDKLTEKINDFQDHQKHVMNEIHRVTELLNGEEISLQKWEELQQIRTELREAVTEAVEARGAAFQALSDLRDKHERFNELEHRREALAELAEQYSQLQTVFKGNSFVEYIAEEQLVQVSRAASERLGALTRQRYAIEVDSQGGFIIRDDANGGVKRPVTTLSGGETFLTSLALALSLSAQIQLRGQYPLQFFFLDEGFGTLDSELLDTVISALERLHSSQLAVGVISHVQELRARLPKRLVVNPAEPSGKGTTVTLETL